MCAPEASCQQSFTTVSASIVCTTTNTTTHLAPSLQTSSALEANARRNVRTDITAYSSVRALRAVAWQARP
ncbi:hypothetical protein C8T65DRAFT_674629 [Cerioporus squamosus]|nr:hypothetical protein C8T65DRAFT_674629 [Cerioporus squamosus]